MSRMMIDELLALMTERRSVRTFTRDAVTNEEIRIVLEAARCAPSNSNRQAWKFLIVINEGVKKTLADAVRKKIAEIRSTLKNPDLIAALDSYSEYMTFFTDAPLVIVALSKRSPSVLERLSRDAGLTLPGRTIDAELMSISMALQNMQLAAHALGLGSCCMTGPCIAAAEIQSILDVRPPFELAAIVPVGRYDSPPPAPPRQDILHISEMIE